MLELQAFSLDYNFSLSRFQPLNNFPLLISAVEVAIVDALSPFLKLPPILWDSVLDYLSAVIKVLAASGALLFKVSY
jgi:hypothetical protein